MLDTARVRNEGSLQTIELPANYRFVGERVLVKRMGNAMILLPEAEAWEPLLDSLSQFTEDFLVDRALPPVQAREDFGT
jgi:antitoxin VapB